MNKPFPGDDIVSTLLSQIVPLVPRDGDLCDLGNAIGQILASDPRFRREEGYAVEDLIDGLARGVGRIDEGLKRDFLSLELSPAPAEA